MKSLNYYRYLEQETFSIRFKNLLKSTQTDELSLEDITAEVEAVRQAKYQDFILSDTKHT